MSGALILPALTVLCILCGLRARTNVYEAFVDGAREGLQTLLQIAPHLAAILIASSLFRASGLMDAAQSLLAPLFGALGIPPEASGVVLLRPLSGSAALGAVSEVIAAHGADSRVARLCCVISGASETIFFTGSLYLGAAGVRRARYAVPVSLAAYVVGVLAAAWIV